MTGAKKVHHVQCPGNAAISHCGRVARPGARGHHRRPASRTSRRFRRDCARASAASGRLRTRPAHGHRVRHRRDPVAASAKARRSAARSRCSSATATGRTGRTRCTSAPSRHPMRRARGAPCSRARAPGTPISSGALKYDREDMRDILERASARETTARVAAGALARQFLAHARHRGRRATSSCGRAPPRRSARGHLRAGRGTARRSRRCAASTRRSRPAWWPRSIARSEAGDTYGGAFEVIARGVPVGSRQPRPMGSQARRPPGAGDDVDAGDQGGRNRHGPGGGASFPARRCTTKSSCRRPEVHPRDVGVVRPTQPRRRSRGRHHQRRGPARERLPQADLDADEAAALGRPRDDAGIAGDHRAQRRLCHHGGGRHRRGDGGAGRSPTRSSRSSAATRLPRSIATTPPPAPASASGSPPTGVTS